MTRLTVLAAASTQLRRLLEEVSRAGEEEEVVLLLPDTPSWALKQIVEVDFSTWERGSDSVLVRCCTVGWL